MVYKKYIKRGEKLYGPYTYHSRRIDGKVVSEYHGMKDYKKLVMMSIFSLVGIFLFIGVLSILSNFDLFNSTGFASLQLATDYQPNENVDGVLRLSLSKGELIPEYTSIIVNLAGDEREYSLVELLSEGGVEGEFYLENSFISGSGIGYGVKGVKDIPVEVSFQIEVINSNNAGEDEPVSEDSIEETPEETINETEQVSEESIEVIEETVIDEKEEKEKETKDKTVNEEASKNEISDKTSLTGRVIGFFTGHASLDVLQEIGEVKSESISYGEEINYNVPEGKTIKLIEGSVYSEEESIDDSYIEISINDGVTSITTSYKKSEYGFGKDYVSDEKVYYDVDLSNLNLVAQDGVLDIKLVYDGSVLIETNSDLAVSEEELDTLENNGSIFVKPFTLENPAIYDLTEDEIALLVRETGTESIDTTKSEIINDRLVVRYELGNYWKEFSYDYDGEISDSLLKKIELERKFWLKSLVKEISREFYEGKDVDLFISQFNLSDSNSLSSYVEENETEIVENLVVEETQEEIIEEPSEVVEETTEEPVEETGEEIPTETTEETSETTEEITEEPVEEAPESSVLTGEVVRENETTGVNVFDFFRKFTGKIIESIKNTFN